MKIHRL